MQDSSLKSYAFRKEREPGWLALEELVTKSESWGVKALSAEEKRQLPGLYRSALSSLSVARSISLDRGLLRYLEVLSARAYFVVYGPQTGFWAAMADFAVYRLPRSVRAAKGAILLSALVMLLGFAAGFGATLSDGEWFYGLVSEQMASDRTPASSRAELYDSIYNFSTDQTDRLKIFMAFLFSNNAQVGMLAFALGFAFGIPVFALLFYNGAILGAFLAIYTNHDLGLDMWAWILVHGSTELLAIILCGGAGFVLGHAMIFPGEDTRLNNLMRRGREASVIVIGAVFMFLVAGLLEAYARQLVVDMTDRFTIAAVMFLVWMTYFMFAGRGKG